MKLNDIHIDPLELRWIYASIIITGLFVTLITLDALIHDIHAPSHVETINSATLHLSDEFKEENLGVQVGSDGRITVRMVAGRYGFFPKYIELPSDTPLTFRWVSMDVLHGVHVPMTNMSTMIVPGYVAEVTTSFPKPGEYPMLCNEYCGLGHDHMWSNIEIIAKESWSAPINLIANEG